MKILNFKHDAWREDFSRHAWKSFDNAVMSNNTSDIQTFSLIVICAAIIMLSSSSIHPTMPIHLTIQTWHKGVSAWPWMFEVGRYYISWMHILFIHETNLSFPLIKMARCIFKRILRCRLIQFNASVQYPWQQWPRKNDFISLFNLPLH